MSPQQIDPNGPLAQSLIPPIYSDPYGLGLPLRWQDEQTGELIEAVRTFFAIQPLTERQFTLVRAYCIHYICAPCWDMGCDGDAECDKELADLREEANALSTAEEVNGWIHRCLGVGIDPL